LYIQPAGATHSLKNSKGGLQPRCYPGHLMLFQDTYRANWI